MRRIALQLQELEGSGSSALYAPGAMLRLGCAAGGGGPVLYLIGIGQRPSDPLDELSREVVAFEVAWDHPLLQHDGHLVSI